MLDKPGVVGIGVGLNPAGKPVIHVYKDETTSPTCPTTLDGVAVERRSTGMHRAASVADATGSHVPCRSASRPASPSVATGTLGARVTDGTNVYALSNNHVYAGVNTASIGDPIIQPGRSRTAGATRRTASATLDDVPADQLRRRHTNTMDAAIALTSAGERRYRRRLPTATGRRARSPTPAFDRPGGAEVRAHDGSPARERSPTIDLSVDVCYFALCERSASRRRASSTRSPSLRARSARRVTRALSSSRRAGTSRSRSCSRAATG